MNDALMEIGMISYELQKLKEAVTVFCELHSEIEKKRAFEKDVVPYRDLLTARLTKAIKQRTEEIKKEEDNANQG